MRSTLKKLAIVIAMTTTSLVGVSTSSTAYAAEVDAPVEVELGTVSYPLCYGVMDDLGNGSRVCVNSVTLTPATYPQTGYFAKATGTITRCVLRACVPTNFSLLNTGAGVNANAFVPRLVYTGYARVPLTRVCVSTVCTPSYADVPTYDVIIVPPGSKPVTVCAQNVCSTPAAPGLALETGDLLQAVALNTSA